MVFVIAVVSSGEVGCWGAPPVRVDGLGVFPDILWDMVRPPRPEPNIDTIILAAREGIVSTFNIVEILAVRIRSNDLGPATLVEVDVGITIRRDGRSVSVLVSHERSWRIEKCALTQVGVFPLAWYNSEECATKSSSVWLRGRPIKRTSQRIELR